jgi:archaellum component FlaC
MTELRKLRSLYESVISRINKLEDDTMASIDFGDLAEDDRGVEMILQFCNDITKLVGE